MFPEIALVYELTGHVATALRDGVEQMEYEARVANEMRNAALPPF